MKKILLCAAISLCCFSVFALPVDIQTAQQAAARFMQGKTRSNILNMELAMRYGTPEPAFYIFNINQDEGFVMISADDIIRPVLAYSTEGAFAPDNIAPQLRYWLNGYQEQIRYAVKQAAAPGRETVDRWATLLSDELPPAHTGQKVTGVSPLLTTTWNQMPLYNNLCPVPGGDPNNSTPAGCVATAMAQIMNYWQFPAQGTGTHTYTGSTVGGTLSANFGATAYDWANMPDALDWNSSMTEINAVATLMYHCGVAVNMDFDYGGSGAWVIDYFSPIVTDTPCSENAFKNHFGYKSSIEGHERWEYSDADWLALLKNELDNGRPLLYAGHGSFGGHAFDFDGYDNNNMFHINWGWGGVSDGYFTIDNLAPSVLGVGGGAGNFNDYQEALIGIEPAAIESYLAINSPVNTSAASIPLNGAYSASTSIKNTGSGNFSNGVLYLVAADTADPDNSRVLLDSVQTGIAAGSSYTYTFSTQALSLAPATYFLIYTSRENGSTDMEPVHDGVVANGSQLLTVEQPNGIGGTAFAAGFHVYPNPVRDQLHISLKPGNDLLQSVRLYDLQGRELLKREDLNTDKIDIPAGAFASGTYLLELRSGKGVYTQKVTIQ